jgi:hypothetical protein
MIVKPFQPFPKHCLSIIVISKNTTDVGGKTNWETGFVSFVVPLVGHGEKIHWG